MAGDVAELLNLQARSQRKDQWRTIPEAMIRHLVSAPDRRQALADLDKLLAEATTRTKHQVGGWRKDIDGYTATERQFQARRDAAYAEHTAATNAADAALREARNAKAGAARAQSMRAHAKHRIREAETRLSNLQAAVEQARELFSATDAATLAHELGIDITGAKQ